jgi:hypothetical protein
MEAVRTSETSVDNHFTRQYIPEDNSEHHTRRRENLKSHILLFNSYVKMRMQDLLLYQYKSTASKGNNLFIALNRANDRFKTMFK